MYKNFKNYEVIFPTRFECNFVLPHSFRVYFRQPAMTFIPVDRIVTKDEPGNLQSYLTTTKLWKLTVVLDYYEAMETYSRIWMETMRDYANSHYTIPQVSRLGYFQNSSNEI